MQDKEFSEFIHRLKLATGGVPRIVSWAVKYISSIEFDICSPDLFGRDFLRFILEGNNIDAPNRTLYPYLDLDEVGKKQYVAFLQLASLGLSVDINQEMIIKVHGNHIPVSFIEECNKYNLYLTDLHCVTEMIH